MGKMFCRRRALRHGLSLFGLVILAGNLAAHEAVVFERDVRPILLRGCGGIACHLNVASSGVSLKTFEDVMASEGLQYGGPIVIPGDPAASPLFDKIANDVPMFGFRMPFGGADPLTDAEIDTIREWIEDGAIQSHLLARGDVNQDDTLNVTDAVRILGFLFRGGEAPACPAQADVDADGNVNLTDPIFVLNFLFLGGPRPSRLSEEENEVCEEAGELSFESIYQNVFLTTCAFSSCHGGALPRAGLDLSTADAAYAALASVLPSNDVARAAGLLRVDPGTPDNSFLLKKLLGPGPGEGNRMPANSATPLSDAAIGAIREWILAGAPREGTIDGVSDIDEESPPSVPAVPQPPVPENGFQLHLGPFNVGARREREILSYAHQPFANLGLDEVVVRRIDIHMSEASHHFILYNWIGGGRP
ncbi:MAG: dockerin type I domain-containing protein [Planctomycetota bacterium]|nr:dockerin type I domain-containing protein [Planctomycetota bacterium]